MGGAARDSGEIDLLHALIRRRYGDRLTDEQLQALRKMVEAMVEHVVAMRGVSLTNADEPLQHFTPFRGDE
jgi:hypothetical protein